MYELGVDELEFCAPELPPAAGKAFEDIGLAILGLDAGHAKHAPEGHHFPMPTRHRRVDEFLDPRLAHPTDDDIPPERQSTARESVRAMLSTIRA